MVNALILPTIDCMRITGPLDYQPMNLHARQANPQFSPPRPPPRNRQQRQQRWKPQRPREPESPRRPLPTKISTRIQPWPSPTPSPLIDPFIFTTPSPSCPAKYCWNESINLELRSWTVLFTVYTSKYIENEFRYVQKLGFISLRVYTYCGIEFWF